MQSSMNSEVRGIDPREWEIRKLGGLDRQVLRVGRLTLWMSILMSTCLASAVCTGGMDGTALSCLAFGMLRSVKNQATCLHRGNRRRVSIMSPVRRSRHPGATPDCSPRSPKYLIMDPNSSRSHKPSSPPSSRPNIGPSSRVATLNETPVSGLTEIWRAQ